MTELTVCQPNTGSTVQLPLLFIPPVDSPAGIYASERHPADTRRTPPTYLSTYRPPPDPPPHPHREINNPPHSRRPRSFFYQRQTGEIYKNTPPWLPPRRRGGTMRDPAGAQMCCTIDEIIRGKTGRSIRFPELDGRNCKAKMLLQCIYNSDDAQR